MTNLQGDVTAIVNLSGDNEAIYNYDAFGKITSMNYTTVSQTNPLRYRGYYFDSETGFYYLKSRYYDPTICRFLNSDDASNLGIEGNFTCFNLFAYCGNNPITGYDPTGKWNWGGVLTGLAIVAVGVVAIAATIASCGTAAPVAATVFASSMAFTAECAVVSTGATIAATAANDGVAVLDITCSANRVRRGTSLVMDFGNNTCELYAHAGYGNSDGSGLSYSTGVVGNYNKLGDYSGEFIEAGASISGYGMSYCQDPSKAFSEGAYAVCTSFSPGNRKTSLGLSYDYYISVASWNF